MSSELAAGIARGGSGCLPGARQPASGAPHSPRQPWPPLAIGTTGNPEHSCLGDVVGRPDIVGALNRSLGNLPRDKASVLLMRHGPRRS
ncbi:MAG TPA: hypothetical protein VLH79_16305 [Chthonomonadales bacterium]|nr:hypothetical protein [Chthonomonadales bacterium]